MFSKERKTAKVYKPCNESHFILGKKEKKFRNTSTLKGFLQPCFVLHIAEKSRMVACRYCKGIGRMLNNAASDKQSFNTFAKLKKMLKKCYCFTRLKENLTKSVS